MKWLVDLVIEAIGVPPCYIDRGDPSGYDYTLGDFTVDGDFHEIDLSWVVPEGATAVSLTGYFKCVAVDRHITFRKHGNVHDVIGFRTSNALGNVTSRYDGTVAVDGDRKIDYRMEAGEYATHFMAVKGWWL